MNQDDAKRELDRIKSLNLWCFIFFPDGKIEVYTALVQALGHTDEYNKLVEAMQALDMNADPKVGSVEIWEKK